MNRSDDIERLEDMDFIVPSAAIWEDYPYPEELIKKAIAMIAAGVHSLTICKELELERSRMLYWMGQYRRGRRWESEPQ